jgi:L-arabinonolactonase
VTEFALPERAGFIKPRAADGFVIGFASRVALSDSGLTSFRTIATIEPELPQTRINDAAVDPFGGIVFGT